MTRDTLSEVAQNGMTPLRMGSASRRSAAQNTTEAPAGLDSALRRDAVIALIADPNAEFGAARPHLERMRSHPLQRVAYICAAVGSAVQYESSRECC